jgi:hypothetical protein
VPLATIAKSFGAGADSSVYIRNQIFTLPNQSKLKDSRVQNLIIDELNKDHVVNAFFDEDATKMILDSTPTPDTIRRKSATSNVVKAPFAP